MIGYIRFDEFNERNETAGVVVERHGNKTSVVFKKNEHGRKAKEQFIKLFGLENKKIGGYYVFND